MELLTAFIQTRKRTEEICSPLTIEDYVPQSAEFASPPKWHLAHSSWFFEEMILKKFKLNYSEFHANFSYLFNSYYNSIGERTERANRGNITRPGVDEVYQYRKYVTEHMKELLTSATTAEVLTLTELGINHEQQHQELLITDLKFTLGQNPIFPVYSTEGSLINSHNTESGYLFIEEGVYDIGYLGNNFHFDNELGRHKVYLHEFSISKSLVTNGEYLEFMEDGGYQDFRHWLDEGWSWINQHNIKTPLYWHKIENNWFQFTLAGLKPVDPNSILCHISFYEANAFATWKKMRLPTEFEWEVASSQLNWGDRWEWTHSAYLPYPGFNISEGAVGEYNGKFMINQMVLRGGSVATADGHSRATYRNFFHPKFQWQFSGIRLVN